MYYVWSEENIMNEIPKPLMWKVMVSIFRDFLHGWNIRTGDQKIRPKTAIWQFSRCSVDVLFEVSLNSLVRSDRFVRFVGLTTPRKISICGSNKFSNWFKYQYYSIK